MNKRDFTRVIEPLEKIGAFFYPKNKKTLPLIIEGTSMPLAQKHVESLGSAQVKSLILMSALSTPGITTIEEKKISRNHTELFLKKIKADIIVKKYKSAIKGGAHKTFAVPSGGVVCVQIWKVFKYKAFYPFSRLKKMYNVFRFFF